jgi:hypothetical protein
LSGSTAITEPTQHVSKQLEVHARASSSAKPRCLSAFEFAHLMGDRRGELIDCGELVLRD